MMRTTTVSYKNHKVIRKDPSEWIVTENTHEPIISQELWDKIREIEAGVSRGKSSSNGRVKPLCGMMYCADCGYKMKAGTRVRTRKTGEVIRDYNYNCSSYALYGKGHCSTNFIRTYEIEGAITADIRSMAKLVLEDEEAARKAFLNKKQQQSAKQSKADTKKLNDCKSRFDELEKLMQSVYEDKVMGKIPEHICVNLLEKYEKEQTELREIIKELEDKISEEKQDKADVDEFIRRLKKYFDIHELTREICLELIEYVTVGKRAPRQIKRNKYLK